MKTTLRADAELLHVTAVADIGLLEKRLELKRICAAALSAGRVDEALIATMLPGLSPSACRNVLRSLGYQRLTANGALTALGQRCAASGEAPAWEQGCYTFLIARHPAFGVWPLAFRRERADNKVPDSPDIEPLPAWLTPTPDRVWSPAVGEGAPFTIAAFPALPGAVARARVVQLKPATLVWELNLATGGNRMHVEGQLDGLSIRSTQMMAPEVEIAPLFSQWEPNWDVAARRLLMSYDGAGTRTGQDSFTRERTYPMVKVEGRGSFSNVKVTDIPVGPRGVAEARQWAVSLLLARVEREDRYANQASVARLWGEVTTNSPLSAAGAAPEPLALRDAAPATAARLRWLLAAPTDLTLEQTA